MRALHPVASCLLVALLAAGTLAGCARGQQTVQASPPGTLAARVTREELARLAEDAYQRQEWALAEQHYQSLTRQAPDDVEAWFRLGNVQARRGREDAAIASFREVTRREPSHTRAWHNLGIVQMRSAQRTFAEMQEHADQADPLSRRGLELANGLGSLLETEGQVAAPAPPSAASPVSP